jgi:SH3-like domain-containing protein
VVSPSFTRLRPVAFVLAILAVVGTVIATTSCGSSNSSSPRPAIGVAYVGPATMRVREDLAAKADSVAEVKHGDRLEILETRRRLVRVRTAAGVEGWVDANRLMSAEQMEELQRMASGAEKSPSQGTASVFDVLNLHTEPSRPSPSFAQIPEGGSVEVLAHRATPRNSTTRPMALPKTVKATAKQAKKDTKKAGASLLPPPAPPRLPADWEKISRPRSADLPGYEAPAAPPPAPLEDWNLVRTKDGKVGWVLARMLYMAIPDDVAQYAEGNRITAYMAIGEVKDGDDVKKNWLWTTASSGLHTCDFDRIRVFVWSVRRHRYETAYIERNVTGFYPVEVADIPGGKEKGFSLLAEDKDGSLVKRTYAFSGYHVRLVSNPVPLPRKGGGKEPGQDFAAGLDARDLLLLPVHAEPHIGTGKCASVVKILFGAGLEMQQTIPAQGFQMSPTIRNRDFGVADHSLMD